MRVAVEFGYGASASRDWPARTHAALRSGGLELLFGRQKQHSLEVDGDGVALRRLLLLVRDRLCRERPELFLQNDNVCVARVRGPLPLCTRLPARTPARARTGGPASSFSSTVWIGNSKVRAQLMLVARAVAPARPPARATRRRTQLCREGWRHHRVHIYSPRRLSSAKCMYSFTVCVVQK